MYIILHFFKPILKVGIGIKCESEPKQENINCHGVLYSSIAHQASVEDESRADACRQPGEYDEHESDRSIFEVFG